MRAVPMPAQWTSIAPPGRRSISAPASPNQRPTCSPCVSSSQTRSTGAAIVVSRSICMTEPPGRCVTAGLHIGARDATARLHDKAGGGAERVRAAGRVAEAEQAVERSWVAGQQGLQRLGAQAGAGQL